MRDDILHQNGVLKFRIILVNKDLGNPNSKDNDLKALKLGEKD